MLENTQLCKQCKIGQEETDIIYRREVVHEQETGAALNTAEDNSI